MEKVFPSSLHSVLQYTIAGNSVGQLTTAILVFLALLLGVKIFQVLILKKLKLYTEKTTTTLDDTFVKILWGISNLFYILFALFLTTELYLQLNAPVEQGIRIAFIIVAAYEGLKVTQAIIFYGLSRSAVGQNKTSLQGIKLVAKIILWSVGILLVLDNLGVNISALAASLGIGGIAIALAAQNILGDLFSSFSIYFDKPFQVGDYVVLGAHEGTVKKIGLKTTRLESLSGEELVISNAELTSTRIQNYKRMRRRRMELLFGVTYQTKPEKLEQIPKIVESITNNTETCSFDRAHFRAFGASSLDFQCIYYVESSDKKESMDVQEKVNLALLRAFEEAGIEMAYPTQTLYVKKD